jgi:hypothetical protein
MKPNVSVKSRFNVFYILLANRYLIQKSASYINLHFNKLVFPSIYFLIDN